MGKDCVLIFCSRDICYSSGNFFASQLAEAFEELGLEAELCEFSKDGDMDAQLEPLLGKSYRAVVDFNSILPQLVMEDGSPYLEHLKGPFFDYIIDHPLFHYTSLTRKSDNFHVLTVDESHKKYIENYYPVIKSVHALPLGATEAFVTGKKAEDYVLFMGTYDSSHAVWEIIEAAPEPVAETMKKLIEQRIAEPSFPVEEAYLGMLRQRGEELAPEKMASRMTGMYAVELYVRNYFREKVLDTLLEHKIPVVVTGEGWEQYQPAEEQYLTRERGVDFSLSFYRIAKAPVLLNVSPFFPRGMHDRIPAGMANHTVVLTEKNDYLKSRYTQGEHLCFYDLTRLFTVGERAGELLENRQMRKKIEEQGYEAFLKGCTWKQRAKEILRLADEAGQKDIL